MLSSCYPRLALALPEGGAVVPLALYRRNGNGAGLVGLPLELNEGQL